MIGLTCTRNVFSHPFEGNILMGLIVRTWSLKRDESLNYRSCDEELLVSVCLPCNSSSSNQRPAGRITVLSQSSEASTIAGRLEVAPNSSKFDSLIDFPCSSFVPTNNDCQWFHIRFYYNFNTSSSPGRYQWILRICRTVPLNILQSTIDVHTLSAIRVQSYRSALLTHPQWPTVFLPFLLSTRCLPLLVFHFYFLILVSRLWSVKWIDAITLKLMDVELWPTSDIGSHFLCCILGRNSCFSFWTDVILLKVHQHRIGSDLTDLITILSGLLSPGLVLELLVNHLEIVLYNFPEISLILILEIMVVDLRLFSSLNWLTGKRNDP